MDVLEEGTKYHSDHVITFPPAITTACMSPASLMVSDSAKDLGRSKETLKLKQELEREAEAVCVQILPGANVPL